MPIKMPAADFLELAGLTRLNGEVFPRLVLKIWTLAIYSEISLVLGVLVEAGIFPLMLNFLLLNQYSARNAQCLSPKILFVHPVVAVERRLGHLPSNASIAMEKGKLKICTALFSAQSLLNESVMLAMAVAKCQKKNVQIVAAKVLENKAKKLKLSFRRA